MWLLMGCLDLISVGTLKGTGEGAGVFWLAEPYPACVPAWEEEGS